MCGLFLTNLTNRPTDLSQHEYDHLEGVVYIDHLDEEDMEDVTPRLGELAEEFGEGGVTGTRPGNRGLLSCTT